MLTSTTAARFMDDLSPEDSFRNASGITTMGRNAQSMLAESSAAGHLAAGPFASDDDTAVTSFAQDGFDRAKDTATPIAVPLPPSRQIAGAGLLGMILFGAVKKPRVPRCMQAHSVAQSWQ